MSNTEDAKLLQEQENRSMDKSNYYFTIEITSSPEILHQNLVIWKVLPQFQSEKSSFGCVDVAQQSS